MIVKEGNKTLTSGEEGVQQYLQEIRRYPLLTREEERELAVGCARGDAEAIRIMVSSNLRLVVSVAREYAGRGVPLLDLIQEGSIGLLSAAKKFDPTLDVRFSTYAAPWIRQGISRCVLNHTGLIRLPRRTAEQVRKLFAIRLAFQQAGQEPTVEDLAQKSGISADKVQSLLAHMPEVCSLDGEDGTLRGLLEDVHTLQPQEALAREALKETLDALLAQLTDRQRQVLQMRFGMKDGICYSLERISRELGVSKERVRQIQARAMEEIHTLGADLGLEDFLSE